MYKGFAEWVGEMIKHGIVCKEKLELDTSGFIHGGWPAFAQPVVHTTKHNVGSNTQSEAKPDPHPFTDSLPLFIVLFVALGFVLFFAVDSKSGGIACFTISGVLYLLLIIDVLSSYAINNYIFGKALVEEKPQNNREGKQ